VRRTGSASVADTNDVTRPDRHRLDHPSIVDARAVPAREVTDRPLVVDSIEHGMSPGHRVGPADDEIVLRRATDC
jgi:hypothetical protein